MAGVLLRVAENRDEFRVIVVSGPVAQRLVHLGEGELDRVGEVGARAGAGLVDQRADLDDRGFGCSG